MKIGIYSDLHISVTSSIMPIYCKDSKYTTRLQMMIDTARWMYKVFEDEKVELILNGGDTMDSHTIRSEEISALSEFYSYSRGVPEIHIPGNHEILDTELNFYSDSILNNLDFITIYDKPTKVNDIISVIPYMRAEDISNDMLKSLSNKILLSHIDIKGSHLRPDYIMDSGVNPELLSEYFEFTVNGHLHTAEKLDTTNGIIWNIGSITSGSFNDNNNYIPSICILDTETMNIKRVSNPCAILFRRMNIDSIENLKSKIKSLDKKYKYILRVTAPYNIREATRSILGDEKSIVTYRVVSDMSKSHSISIANSNDLDIKTDMKKEFIEFLNKNSESLNYPLEEYLNVIKEVQ